MPKYSPQPVGGKVTNPFESKCIVDVNNKGEPKITTIEKVAIGLGVSVMELIRPPKKK